VSSDKLEARSATKPDKNKKELEDRIDELEAEDEVLQDQVDATTSSKETRTKATRGCSRASLRWWLA